MKKYALMVLLAFLALPAFALTPTNGMWYNQSEPGRGFAIDQQNEYMYVTAYVFTPSGVATWFLAIGKYNPSTNTFSGELGAYTGGQCFGCAHSRSVGESAGHLTITFDSTETGTMTFPGGTTRIQRQVFGYANKTDYLLGAWSFTMELGGRLQTQWFSFDSHYTGSDGTVFASAHSFTSVDNGTIALGAYYPSLNAFLVAAQGDDGYTYQYLFSQGGDKRMRGLGSRYINGGTPTDPTQFSLGSRIAFPIELASGSQVSARRQASLMSPPPADTAKLHELEMSLRETTRSYDTSQLPSYTPTD